MAVKPIRLIMLSICCLGIIGSSPVAHGSVDFMTGLEGPMVQLTQNSQSGELKWLPEVTDRMLASTKLKEGPQDSWILEAVGLPRVCNASKAIAVKFYSEEHKEQVMQALLACGPLENKTIIYISGTSRHCYLYLFWSDGKLRRAVERMPDETGSCCKTIPIPDSQAESNLNREIPSWLAWAKNQHKDLFYP